MSVSGEERGGDAARRILAELAEARRKFADEPAPERRRHLATALERALEDLRDEEARDSVLAELQALLVEEARERQLRLEEAQSKLRQIEARGASRPVRSSAGGSGLAHLAEILRAVARREEREPTRELEQFGEDWVVAATVVAVVETLVDLEWLRLNLFATLGMVPEGSGLVPKLTTEFGNRLERCLAGDEEALHEFREKDLLRIRANFVELARDWQEIAWEGTERVLEELALPSSRELEDLGRKEILRRLREVEERLQDLEGREPEMNVAEFFLPLLRERLERKSLL